MEEDIRDIKGPTSLPFEAGPLLWTLLIAAALLLIAAFIYWAWQRRKKPVPAPPPLPADLEALSELNKLRQEHLPETGKIKEYFFRLSAIARRYLERRFSVRASEQTTEEFLAEMAKSDFLNPAQKTTIKTFMQQSDLVKFAKYPASVGDCEKGETVVRQLVEETRPAEEASEAK